MIVLNTYNDGSQSILFEAGDKVIVERETINYTLMSLDGYKYIPIGTEGTVIRHSVKYNNPPKSVIDPYWVHFKDYGNMKVWPWEIGG